MIYQLDGVSRENGGREVLRGVSFSVSQGERVVLLGVNGCGKTTLLKLLDGLTFAARGTVRYAGRVLDRPALEDAAFHRRFRGEVALLFQNVDAMLFNPTVADEIAFGPRQLGLPGVEERVARWAEVFGVTPFLDRPPFELSGGEKKRVALAAILAIEPKVLLLDEPSANLDPASSALLVDVLAGLDGVTTLAATPNASMAEELGSRALLLGPGGSGVLYDGPPQDLLGDERLLVESGLAHRHAHRHGGRPHVHPHLHDAD
ncbi:MAG TPA: ABC transporter ATP-binding protein [Anaeromyxobacteraceae bacterium]|nr:ABC transporter ATP-binding protein [Anaeromyxobacteraceae bacterium]